MSNVPALGDKAGWRAEIEKFLQDRLQVKLGKLSPDDPQRDEVIASYVRDAWLEDAARRVSQIQAVTHSLKPIHPDARGTNLYVEPLQLPPLAELGSHALGAAFAGDVVGNAAALDVYKLLKLQVGGQSLLSALLAEDAGALQALHDEPVQAKALRDALVSLIEARAGGPSSHSRAKQLYWLTGDDAADDAQYELLAPLYATSLAHAVYGEIQEHRFGDANKAARIARRERKEHDGVFHDYPSLAVQKMGGSNKQNLGMLNLARNGNNYLLSSLPPTWTPNAVRLPMHASSVFDRMFMARPGVRQTVKALRHFLAKEAQANKPSRDMRKAYTDSLLDELVAFAGELQQLMQPGWSKDGQRFEDLAYMEKLWLDPLRAELKEEKQFASDWMYMDWPAEIGKRFGAWLNKALGEQFGDVEAREWRKELLTDEDGFKQQLRELRDKLDAPHYIPIRQTHDELIAARGATA